MIWVDELSVSPQCVPAAAQNDQCGEVWKREDPPEKKKANTLIPPLLLTVTRRNSSLSETGKQLASRDSTCNKCRQIRAAPKSCGKLGHDLQRSGDAESEMVWRIMGVAGNLTVRPSTV